jgi:hypothetical protein
LLADLAESRMGLTPVMPQASAWADHIVQCAECQSRMAEIEETLRTLRAGDAGDAPDTWIRRAQLRSVPRKFREPPRGELVATLLFDSAIDVIEGTRAEASQSRQFIVAADRLEVEISLAHESASERWPLTGQLFVTGGGEHEGASCRVTLLESGAERAHVTATASGEFLFEQRPRGPFELRFEGPQWSVVTPTLTP